MRPIACLVALSAAVAGGPLSAQLVTAGAPGRTALSYGASVNVRASGDAGVRPFVTVSRSDDKTAAVMPFDDAPIARANGFARDGLPYASAEATARTGISFIPTGGMDSFETPRDPGRARIEFTGYSNATSYAPNGAAAASGGHFLTYTFTALKDVAFDLDYAFSAATLGCCGNRIELRDLTANRYLFGQTIYGTATRGSLAASLLAGSAYTLSISKGQYEGTDAASVRGTGSRDLPYADVISFAITDPNAAAAVPEPESWAMIIVGFGLTGIAARRRRAAGRDTAVA